MDAVKQAIRTIKRAQNVAVVTHISPDPDAIGSLLGLSISLRAKGKSVTALCNDPVPRSLRFLPGSDTILSTLPSRFTPDILVCLDASDTERLGKIAAPLLSSGIPVINIDHHVTNVNYGSVNIVRERSSAAEVVMMLLDSMGCPINTDAAACLTAGIVGDTRSFATANVTAETLEAAARLVNIGVDLAHITERVFHRLPVKTLQLWGVGLDSLKLEKQVIWTALAHDRLRALKLDNTSTTGLSSMLLQAEEANISAVFSEQADGTVEVSLRAKPGYEIASIAFELGGGGHPLAAGCTLTGSLENVTSRVLTRLQERAAQGVHEQQPA